MEAKAPRGTRDILPAEVRAWQQLEASVRRVCDRFGYEEIRTPLFEKTDLFVRGVGETTDIVEKQMYTFEDRRGRSLTLRPEGTAPVVRAFLEHGWQGTGTTRKLYYIGPMFRYEKPQAGRYRQFHQFGAEALGSADPLVDVEIVALPLSILRDLGLDAEGLELNSIGCPDCRPAYRARLTAYLEPHRDELCRECKARIERNPLRVLDCKEPGCRRIAQGAPASVDHLCEPCATHLRDVQRGLEAIDIAYDMNHLLVRGLDYYTRTVFELRSTSLGAQDALAGGGRYDGLVEACGGPSTPAVGFASGVERVLLALDAAGWSPDAAGGVDVYFVCAGEAARQKALPLLYELRAAGLRAAMDHQGRSMRGQMKAAGRSGAGQAVILGDDELARGSATLRSMADGSQRQVPFAALPGVLERE